MTTTPSTTKPSKPPARYGPGRRALYGVMWAFYSAVLVIGGFVSLANGDFFGLLELALAALTIRYDYKIWTYQARRLWFFILF